MLTEKTKVFLQAVCQEIRWPAAHASIRAELSSHVAEHAEALMAEGVDAASAEEQAIRAMGNAQEIGRQLDKLHRPKLAKKVLILGIMLTILSLARIIYMATHGYGLSLLSILCGLIIGIGGAMIVYFSDYTKWLKWSPILYAMGAALVVGISLVDKIMGQGWGGVDFYDLWINVYTIAALFFIAATAGFIELYRYSGAKGLVGCGALAIGATGAIMHGHPSMAVFMFFWYIVLFVLVIHWGYFGSDQKRSYTLVYGATGTILFSVVCYVLLHSGKVRLARMLGLTNFLQFRWQTCWLYQTLQQAQLIGSAEGSLAENITLDAMYASRLLHKYALLEIINDFGMLAGILVLGILLLLVYECWRKLCLVKDHYGKLLGLSALALLGGQTLSNVLSTMEIGWNSLQLPFFSAGGTNMVMSWLLLGVVLSVWRRSSILSEVEPRARSAEGIDAAATEAE